MAIAFIFTVASSPLIISWYERYRQYVYNPFYRFTKRERLAYPNNSDHQLRAIYKLDYVLKAFGLKDCRSRTVIGKPSLYLPKYVDSGIVYEQVKTTFKNDFDFAAYEQDPDFILLCKQHRVVCLEYKDDSIAISPEYTQEISTEKLYLFLWGFITSFLEVNPSQLVLEKCFEMAIAKKSEELGFSVESFTTLAFLNVIDYLRYLLPTLDEAIQQNLEQRLISPSLTPIEQYQLLRNWFLSRGEL